jgi:peptidoglycan/LPS O-acetylase OafA/YrhL
MCVSCLLWLTSGLWKRLLDNSLFAFIGRNTIWIYLWHIPFVNIVVKGPFDAWHPLWKYIFVYVAALCIYALQYKIVGMVRKRWPNNVITKYFVG